MSTTYTPTPRPSTAARRAGLIDMARSLARRARRARQVGILQDVRHIGAQLDALEPWDAEARDFLDAAREALGDRCIQLDRLGA